MSGRGPRIATGAVAGGLTGAIALAVDRGASG
jgi:hypothetical protein